MAESNSATNHLNHYNFPKAELHCHLDGSFRLETIIDLAKKRGIPLPTYNPAGFAEKVCCLTRKKCLSDYLSGFHTTTPTFAGCKDSIARVVREAIEDKSRDGVRYLELRFSPHLLANCDVTPMLNCKEKGTLTPRRVVETVLKATEEAQQKFNIIVRIILCCILDFKDWSMEVAHLCKDFAGRGVVAMDIAGAPRRPIFDIKHHVKAFQFCKDNGIHITVHAGEAGDSQEVDDAMRLLYAERIGHGYHAVDDQKVYAESKRRNIHFEVCPISSYLTGSVDTDLSRHPARRFLKDEVNFSLSTDDPAFNQKNLIDDYLFAAKNFQFSSDDIKKLNLNALRSAFCQPSLRDTLCKEFETAYEK